MIIRKGVFRIRSGPRRSRVRIGPRPFLFFLGTAILLCVIAIALNLAIEERWKAYRAFLDDTPAAQEHG